MNRNANIFFAALMAFIVAIIHILHEKLGGFLRGSGYTTPHSWSEVFEKFPEFIGLFFIVFLAAYIYFDYKDNKSS